MNSPVFLFSKKEPPQTNSDRPTAAHLIHRWREKLVLTFLRGFFFLALLASLIGIPYFLIGSVGYGYYNWILTGAALVISMVIVLGVVSFARVPYMVRACGALLMPFMFTIYGLLDAGAEGDSMMMILVFIVLAFMLLGVRGGMLALVISALLYCGVGWVMVTHKMTKITTFEYDHLLAYWVMIATEVLGFTGVLSLGVVTLQDALATAHQRERVALEEVEHERAQLETRVVERTQELRHSNLKLEQAYQQLQAHQETMLFSEKMASLGRLTAGLAHEMNTPLAAVQASLFELDKLVGEYDQSIGSQSVDAGDHQAIAEEMSQVVDISKRSITRALDFIRSVKSQAREFDKTQQQRFDVVQIVEDVLLLMDHDLKRNNCEVAVETQVETVELVGSAGSFAPVVTNLIENAIDAGIPKGGGLITIELIEKEERIIFQVRDKGVGIPDEIRTKIFDPLFTTKPFGEGTGLGLSIVHDIVTRGFHGTIDVTSQPGKGTTFSICIPRFGE